MTENELIYEQMCQITGPYREYSPVAQHRIYGSYHFDQFNRTNAWRNTLVRFEEFHLPTTLNGYKIFDFGACLGSLSFEANRRGAQQVTGFEFNQTRVDLSNRLAHYLQLEEKLRFIQMDLNQQDLGVFLEQYGQAEIVFCCALDKYLDKERLYRFVSAVTQNLCYFETNSQIKPDLFSQLMRENGFELIVCLGSSQSNKDPYRCSYLLQKKPSILQEKKGILCEIAGQMVPINNRVYRIHDHILIQYQDPVFNSIQRIYEKVKDIKYVPPMKFHRPFIVTPYYTGCLFKYQATTQEKDVIKEQLIDFVRQMNRRGLAHRDLHIKNVYFDHNLLRIADWEVACENPSQLETCYDLTGQINGVSGYKYQLEGDIRVYVFVHHVLLDNCLSFRRYLDGNLKLSDFVESKN